MSFSELYAEAWYDKLGIITTAEIEIIKELFDSIAKKNIDIADIDYLYFYVNKIDGWDKIGGLYSIDFSYREVNEEERFLELTPIGTFGHMFENVAISNFYALYNKIKMEGYEVIEVFEDLKMHCFRVNLEDVKHAVFDV